MTVSHFDASTFLAHRALDAVELGPPKPPKHVALPGAKRAVEHERLLALQDAGNDQHAITARTNAKHAAESSQRLADHQVWVAGMYSQAIVQMREQQALAAAAEQRRRAMFEQIMREREESSGA